jgi:hypothetical protein
MDNRRFDDLSRLAARSSRRQAFKALGGGAAGGLLAMLGIRRDVVEAASEDCCPPDHPRLCGYTCLDVSSDVKNCGDCGVVCGKGQICSNGVCAARVKCPKGQTSCGGVCVTLASDPNNCGSCGAVCDPANAQGVCSNGTCQMGTCNAGYADCDADPANGCEVNINSDPDNCGGCGVACDAGQTCENGACTGPAGECTPTDTRSCYSGPAGTAGVGICAYGTQTCGNDATWGACVGEVLPQTEICNNLDDDCNGVIDNGFDKQHDVNNCGTCGNVCQFPNAVASCTNGICGIASCNAGWGDCDGDPSNGCEDDTSNDPNNCGGCGVVCASGQTCLNGVCGVS